MNEPGSRDRLLRHLVIGLVLALIIYFTAFALVEHSRQRKGGWRVTFVSDAAAVPSLHIDQPALGLSNVTLLFPGAHLEQPSQKEAIVFDRPLTNVPFGKVVYLDTTFLPGAIVLDMFGHEIQLLPRVLMLDRREVPWKSGSDFTLRMANAERTNGSAAKPQ